jgi:hypothetical protein
LLRAIQVGPIQVEERPTQMGRAFVGMHAAIFALGLLGIG